MIYLDMDGVIADFFGGIEQRFGVDHWKSLTDKEVNFATLCNTDFFNTLPCFFRDGRNLSDKIVEHVKIMASEYEIKWGICSSPLRNDNNNSAYWKREWLQDMGYMPEVEMCIFTSNKHKYAWSEIDRKPNILIDDKPKNILDWNDAGGIGIRFQANEDDFEEYLIPEIRKALQQR